MKLWALLLLYLVSMTKAYVLIDPLTGRPIEERSPTIQESRSEQQFFDEQSQSFDGQDLRVRRQAFYGRRFRPRVSSGSEYYGQTGTPAYKLRQRNPYGGR